MRRIIVVVMMSLLGCAATGPPKGPEPRFMDVAALQLCLRQLGYDPGSIVGQYTWETDKAFSQFLEDRFGPAWVTVDNAVIRERLSRDCRKAGAKRGREGR